MEIEVADIASVYCFMLDCRFYWIMTLFIILYFKTILEQNGVEY